MNEEIMFRMGLNPQDFKDNLKASSLQAKMFGQEVKKDLDSSLKGLIAGYFSAEGVKKLAEFADQIKRTAEISGASTDFVQNFARAVISVGGDAQQSNSALEKLAGFIGEAMQGNQEAINKFNQVGISFVDASGQAKTAVDVWYELGQKVGDAKTATEAAALAMDIWGTKFGAQLVPLLREGREGVDKFNESLKLTTEQVNDLAEAKNNITDFFMTLQVVAGKAIEAIANVAKYISIVVEKMGELYKKKGFAEHGAFDIREYPGVIRAANAEAAIQFAGDPVAQGKVVTPNQKGQGAEDSAAKINKEKQEYNRIMQEAIKLWAENNDKQENSEARQAHINELAEANLKLKHKLDYEHLSAIERAKIDLEIEQNRAEILKEQKAIEEAKTKEKKEQERTANAQYNIDKQTTELHKQERELQQSKAAGRSQLTIEELVNSPYRYRGQLGQDQNTAYRISQLSSIGEQYREHGYLDIAGNIAKEIDRLKGTLSSNVPDSERFPFRSMEEGVQKTSEGIDELLRKATDEGLKVTVNLAP